MLRGRNLLIENRNPDRLDIFPRLMEGRHIQECFLVNAVPAEEHHRPRILLRRFLQLRDEIGLVGGLDQALHLVLIVRRQILEPVNALVDIRQRQQIKQRVERRQQPGRKSIADEIAPQRCKIRSRIAADVVGAANRVEQRNLWEEIGERSEHAQRKQDPPDGKFPYSGDALSARQRFGEHRTHNAFPCSACPSVSRAIRRDRACRQESIGSAPGSHIGTILASNARV